MRWDMKEVIVEVARAGGGGKDKRPKALRDDDGFPDLPAHERMRYRKDKSQGDKLGPLYSFLESRIGQQWDDVFSEICEVNDKRSMLGFHLLTHLAQYVQAPGLKNSRYFNADFFEDFDGTLQRAKNNRPWIRQNVEAELKEPIVSFPAADGWRFEKVDGQWYRVKEEVIPDTYVASEYIDEQKYEIVRVIKPTTHTKRWKFQCNKKEMRQIREAIALELEKRRRAYTRVLAKMNSGD